MMQPDGNGQKHPPRTRNRRAGCAALLILIAVGGIVLGLATTGKPGNIVIARFQSRWGLHYWVFDQPSPHGEKVVFLREWWIGPYDHIELVSTDPRFEWRHPAPDLAAVPRGPHAYNAYWKGAKQPFFLIDVP